MLMPAYERLGCLFRTESAPLGLAYSTIRPKPSRNMTRRRVKAMRSNLPDPMNTSVFQRSTAGVGRHTGVTTQHKVAPPPPPRRDRPRQFVPVRSIRTSNSMGQIDFSEWQTSEFRPSVRDRFGPERSSGMTPKIHLVFFGFVTSRQ